MEKTKLKSGLTIITERYSQFPSFALSYTLKSGSRNEKEHNNGIHHLIEHMLFKGSNEYSQKEIAEISDRLGGRMNAFTSREITQYYIKSINEKLPESFNLLSDIVFNSNFDEIEFEKEKSVICQEIKEGDDNPDSKVFEYFYKDIFGNSGIGLPIAGTIQSVSEFSRGSVFDKYGTLYIPANIILCCVGSVSHKDIVSLAEKKFPKVYDKVKNGIKDCKPSFASGTFIHRNRNIKQVYSVIGFESIPITSPKRYAYMILNDILGAGMSSRLFQKIREDKGLAYTVNSFIDSYDSFGIHMIYAITDSGKITDYLNAIKDEVTILKKNGISKEELHKSKDHIKSSLVLSLENNVSKMRFFLNGELYFNKKRNIDDMIGKIDKIGLKDINEILENYPNTDRVSTVLYGNIPENEPFDFN